MAGATEGMEGEGAAGACTATYMGRRHGRNQPAVTPRRNLGWPIGVHSYISVRVMDLSIVKAPAVLGEGNAARVSLRLLILIRWVAVIGQAIALLVVQFGYGYPLPFGMAGAVVAASAVFNLIASRQRHGGSRLGDHSHSVRSLDR